MKKLSKKQFLYFSLFIAILILITVICIKLIPLLLSLKDSQRQLEFKSYIDSLGFYGILIMVLIQILQVFIAFIPGEIVELLAGLLYGTWGGLAICLIGNAIASFLIFVTVKFFAKNSMDKYQKKLSQYSFLNNKRKIALYLFIIYLIPGIPKDIITYLVPFLPINFLTFIIVTSIARIPSIISSTYSSASFLNNNYTIAIIILVIFAVLGILGFAFKDKIINALKKDNNRDQQNSNKTGK